MRLRCADRLGEAHNNRRVPLLRLGVVVEFSAANGAVTHLHRQCQLAYALSRAAGYCFGRSRGGREERATHVSGNLLQSVKGDGLQKI